MNGRQIKTRLGRTRRLLALAFALVMLLQSEALTQLARAIESDPTTGTISLFRWDRTTDLLNYIKSSKTRRYLLLTWTDGGQRYYFRTKKGTSESNTAKYKNVGPYTNHCTYSLTDSLVSTQPVMKEALDGNLGLFFTTEIDASLSFRYSSGNSFRLDFGAVIEDDLYAMYGIELCYDNSTWGLCSPKYDDGGISQWVCENYGSAGGVRIHGITNAKEKGSKGLNSLSVPVYLNHNGNQIGSGVVGSGSDYISQASTVFEAPYVATEYTGISAITHDFAVQENMVTSLNNVGTYLSPNCTLTVKNGGVLSIGGTLLNDGRIVVEKGGLLILKEGATIAPYTKDNVNGGGISSKGSIVVRQDAKLIGGGTNGIFLSGGGVVNFGLIASENFRVMNSHTIENRKGGAVYAGKSLNRKLTYDCLAASLDRTKPVSNTTVGESSLTTFLSGGDVLLAANAVIDKGGTFRDYGSFGDAANSESDPIVKVYQQLDPEENGVVQVLAAHKSEIGFYLSEPMCYSYQEYLDLSGWREYYRGKYEQESGRAPTDAELERYISPNIPTSGYFTATQGYFTLNGEIAATIPWYNWFILYENGERVVDGAMPGARRAQELAGLGYAGGTQLEGSNLFEDAPLIGRTFILEPLCAPGSQAEVKGASTASGEGVRITPASSDELHRMWRFERGDVFWSEEGVDYYYYLVNVSSGLALTLPDNAQTAVQSAKQSQTSAQSQLFRVEEAGNGTYRLIPRGSADMALTVDAEADNGVRAMLRADEDTQKWRVIETDETPFVGRTFELEPVCAPGMRMEVINGTTYYGYTVLLGEDKDVAYQRWRFDKAAIVHENNETHYYYYLCPIHWRHTLGTSNTSPKNGTDVQQTKAAEYNSRMWRLVDNGDGTYGLVNRANQSLRLNVDGSGSASGTNVNVATAANSTGQRWRLIPV